MNPTQLAAEAAQQAWDKNLIDQNGKTPLKSIIQAAIEKATEWLRRDLNQLGMVVIEMQKERDRAAHASEPAGTKRDLESRERYDKPAHASEQDLLDLAWGIIANAGGGDWTKESPEWQEAAEKWRDRYKVLPAAHASEKWPRPDNWHKPSHASEPIVGLNHVTLRFPDCDGKPCKVIPTLEGNLQVGSAAAMVSSAEFEAIAKLRDKALGRKPAHASERDMSDPDDECDCHDQSASSCRIHGPIFRAAHASEQGADTKRYQFCKNHRGIAIQIFRDCEGMDVNAPDSMIDAAMSQSATTEK